MTELGRLLPEAGLVEIDAIDVAAGPEQAWDRIRNGDIAGAAPIRALFALRALPSRLRGERSDPSLRLDDIHSSPGRPGFQILSSEPPHEVVAGAIGQVWRPAIPFRHVDGADAFAAFDEPGQVKVAWAIRVTPGAEGGSTIAVEVRVAGTDPRAWRRFQRYFRVIGPGSRFVRRTMLARLERDLGARRRALPGDALLADAGREMTHAVAIAAPPERVWPWLVQMGHGRGGFYSIDLLDNRWSRSAREPHPELADIAVGDLMPATAGGEGGFEVLEVEEGRALVLGGLWDADARHQRPFSAPRPGRYWHVTWSFALEPLEGGATRLLARARAAFPPSGRAHVTWVGPAHRLMQTTQLRNLAERAEGRLPPNDWRDVLAGVGGAGLMGLSIVTPMARARRSRWGAPPEVVGRHHPGDDLVPEPSSGWTHAVEVAAPVARVWPWVAQIGADRAGFYSYSWLENLVGCDLRDAERIHPEWEMHEGDSLLLHPAAPPLRIVSLEPGHHLVAYGAPDEDARREGRPWIAASWLFLVEEMTPGLTRVVSRYRCATSDDARTRLLFGPALVEPIGDTMDRRMLKGIRARAEHTPRPLGRV